MSTPIDFEDSEFRENEKSLIQIAFSQGMNEELDAVQYAPSPRRSAALAAELGLGRTQAYRLLKGLAAPSVECLALLRRKGVSIDRIFDEINGDLMIDPVDIVLNGTLVSTVIQRPLPGKAYVYAAVKNGTGSHELMSIFAGQTAPADAIPVQSLQFVAKDTLAIVEDDSQTLTLLTSQMSRTFRVASFGDASSLLRSSDDLGAFNAFLLDWRLPDMSGERLVQSIRERTNAPIFLLTGDSSASSSIAKVLGYLNVHYVAKPVDEIILSRQILNSIIYFNQKRNK